MPFTGETSDFIADAERILAGSPYLIRDDEVGRARAAAIRERLADLVSRQSSLLAHQSQRVQRSVERIHRSREVFESNAIEGAGLPLADTVAILDRQARRRRTGDDYARWALLEGIKGDRHAYEVIGLDAARTLAGDIAKDLSRPVSEADIRQMHKVIMGSDAVGGRYKRLHVTIAGSDHEPPTPIETPVHMEHFIRWLEESRSAVEDLAGGVVRAGAAHAWFAHIHPFEDGNGRLARLLANMALASVQGPPLIVRNRADRSQYIDALGVSDEAGDLARLLVVMGKYLVRTADEYLSPEAAEHAFDADMAATSGDDYDRWSRLSGHLLSDLQTALVPYRIELRPVGDLAPGDFSYLRQRNIRGNSWAARLDASGRRIGLLWYGYAPDFVATRLEDDQIHPALYLSVATLDPTAPHPYARVTNLPGHPTGFMIEPPESVWAIAPEGRRLDRLDVTSAPSVIAESIYAMTKADFDAITRYV